MTDPLRARSRCIEPLCSGVVRRRGDWNMTAPSERSSTFRRRLTQWRLRTRSAKWIRNGRVPGSSGYSAARWGAIERELSTQSPHGYGYHDAGLDERVVEYPWALHRLRERWVPGTPILDAGSAL